MADDSHTDDRVWRAVEEHRARSLHQLEDLAADALGDLFPPRRRHPSETKSEHELARMIARDLTALGLVVHDSAGSVSTGGVWLGPCADHPGVIVAWTQHEAATTVLGHRLHRDLQETMNLDLAEVLRLLGYRVTDSGCGGASVVTAPRPR